MLENAKRFLGLSAANTNRDTANNAECAHLRYSPLRKVVEAGCTGDDTQAPDRASSLTTTPMPADSHISASAPAAPAWVNAVIKNGNDITISWAAVSGVSSYNRQVSLNGGNWQNTKTYPSTQTSVIFYDQQVRSYRYQVRACNSAGCSTWRQSNSVTVHPTPVPPGNPVTVPVVSGGNYHPFNTSQIHVSVAAIAGADEYKVYVGTSPTWLPDIHSSTSTNLSFTPPPISYGYVYITYAACNSAGCSAQQSAPQRILLYNIPASPNNVTLNSNSLSWTAAGGMIPTGQYKILETRPGAAQQHIATIAAGFESGYSYTIPPFTTPGTYYYRVQACNPGMACANSPSRTGSLANRAPVANNDSGSVNEGGSVTIPVVSNDTDPDGHALSVSHASQPSYGNVNCGSTQCTYTANSNIGSSVTDSFTYTVVDGFGGSASANVYVSITGTAVTPVISPAGGTFTETQAVTISTATSGATIYYTTNGATPGTSSPVYGGPLTLTGSTTLKAIAVKSNHNNSGIRSASFTKAVTPDWAKTGGSAPADSTQSVSSLTSTFNGAINGSAGVSGGAGVYNIPIVVPPGRNGVQPDVSLNFSSRSGAGIAGVGWSLSAGSSISRCPRTIAQDGKIGGINYDLNDRLCLDGQRLVPKVGAYGVNGTTYTTEMESFINVTQNGGSLNQSGVSFTVNLPNGGTRKYGTTTASRVIAGGKTQALSWQIDKYTDVTGNNTMAYHYTTDKSDGEILLDNIKYTGTATGEGNRKIQFFYQDDATFGSSYVAGGLTRSTQRLNYIDTFYGSSRVRRYDLSYKSSVASGRSLLTSVQECGYITNTSTQCRELTTFTWQDKAPTIKQEVMMAGSTEAFPGISSTNILGNAYEMPKDVSKGALSFDVDGNGVRDWHNNGTVYHINAEGALTQTTTNSVPATCNKGRWSHQLICIEADYNVDGMTDGFATVNNKLHIYFARPGTVLPPFDTGINMINAYVVNAQDYNGDGYPDIVINKDNGRYELHTFDPNFDITDRTDKPFNTDSQVLFYATVRHDFGVPTTLRDAQFVGDMNGDGLGDFAVHGQVAKEVFSQPSLLSLKLSNLDSNGDVTFTTHNLYFAGRSQDGPPERWFEDQFIYSSLVDVNGDGMKDWLGYLVDNGNLHYRLNRGDGTFADRTALNVSLPSRKIGVPSVDDFGDYGVPVFALEPRFRANFAQVDIDGDGKPELLMPDKSKIIAEACHWTSEWVTDNQTQDVWKCGNAIEDEIRGGEHKQYINLSPELNRTVYQYQALKFTVEKDGSITARLIDTDYQGTPDDVANVDVYGNGLQDMAFAYGCFNDMCKLQSTSSQHYSGKAGTVFVNRNYGTGNGTSGSDYMPLDMLTSVSNGVGMVSTWDYRPLSSEKYSGSDDDDDDDITSHGSDAYNDGAFYDPVRESFEDGEHFNFASSMYVVGSFTQSNGVSGSNESRYQYSGAVYNSKGRGFRGGFKTITQRDIANKTTTHTRFRQKFPYSSAVDVQTVMEGRRHHWEA